jgi:ubiquinone/menaquinone biosynthesis C-methylase UbiE
MLEPRKIVEREFHDRLAGASGILHRKRPYRATLEGERIVREWIKRHCQGKRILDFCCGTGEWSLEFAMNGADVWGIDIAGQALKRAYERAVGAGYGTKVHFTEMDAEQLAFSGGAFDLIFCAGGLHHLDIAKAYEELSRVLKPSGEIICIEPLRYNPFIAAYRKLTPHLRTPCEMPLSRREMLKARKYFSRVEARFLYLATIIGFVFGKTRLSMRILPILERLDRLVLGIPGVQLLAWQVVLVLAGPRPGVR